MPDCPGLAAGQSSGERHVDRIKTLEPEHSRFYATLWLALVGVIGAELMTLFSLFHFDV